MISKAYSYIKTIGCFLMLTVFIGSRTEATVHLNYGINPEERSVALHINALAAVNRTLGTNQQIVSDIVGKYKAVPADEGGTACDLRVQINKLRGSYFYTFYISGKKHKGKLKVQKGDKAGELYLTFMGMPWAEYEGNEDENSGKALKKPVGISGMWAGNEITIQNTGNSMNNYVQIAGCDQKFINLIKQK